MIYLVERGKNKKEPLWLFSFFLKKRVLLAREGFAGARDPEICLGIKIFLLGFLS